jgi:hypothetical protein
VLEVETVKVEIPDPVTAGGLNDGDAPLGRPLIVKLTVPLNPFDGETDAV